MSLASWPLGRAAFLDLQCAIKATLKKLPTFHDATISFCTKWRLRNDRRNSILMTRHYPDLGRASDWWSHVGNLLQPIITMEILRSFLRHNLAGKPAVAWRNVGGFLRLNQSWRPLLSKSNKKTFVTVYYLKGYLWRSLNIPVPMFIGIPMMIHSLTPTTKQNLIITYMKKHPGNFFIEKQETRRGKASLSTS